ncbi:unnamed protein product [Pedinophyceae sp. YPF-701]|nr:unnamed protein product [Pedinophyceae sp. YPF-701]
MRGSGGAPVGRCALRERPRARRDSAAALKVRYQLPGTAVGRRWRCPCEPASRSPVPSGQLPLRPRCGRTFFPAILWGYRGSEGRGSASGLSEACMTALRGRPCPLPAGGRGHIGRYWHIARRSRDTFGHRRILQISRQHLPTTMFSKVFLLAVLAVLLSAVSAARDLQGHCSRVCQSYTYMDSVSDMCYAKRNCCRYARTSEGDSIWNVRQDFYGHTFPDTWANLASNPGSFKKCVDYYETNNKDLGDCVKFYKAVFGYDKDEADRQCASLEDDRRDCGGNNGDKYSDCEFYQRSVRFCRWVC